MEAAQAVFLVAIAIAIVVVAAFLITVVYQLAMVWNRLNTVLDVVGGVIERTEPLKPIVDEIKADLAGAEGAITASVERLALRKGYAVNGDRAPEPEGGPDTPEAAASTLGTFRR